MRNWAALPSDLESEFTDLVPVKVHRIKRLEEREHGLVNTVWCAGSCLTGTDAAGGKDNVGSVPQFLTDKERLDLIRAATSGRINISNSQLAHGLSAPRDACGSGSVVVDDAGNDGWEADMSELCAGTAGGRSASEHPMCYSE